MEEKAIQDPIVKSVIEQAVKLLKPRRIILFGSRARGDASERSDYDFAFELTRNGASSWSRFSLDAEATTPTLKKLDLVRLDEIDEDFKKRILSEGIVVYEQKR